MTQTMFFLLALLGSLATSIARDCEPNLRRSCPEVEDTEAWKKEMSKMETYMTDLKTIMESKLNQSLEKDAEKNRIKLDQTEARLNTMENDLNEKIAQLHNMKSETEARLNTTESDLNDKITQLHNMKSETEARLNATERELEGIKGKLYEKEKELQAAVDQLKTETEVRLNTTEKELKAEVNKLKNDSEGIQKKLHATERDLKIAVDQLKNETEARFNATERELKAEVEKLKREDDEFRVNLTANAAELTALRRGDAAKFTTIARQLTGQRADVNRLKREVGTKVAFSASLVACGHVFNGPTGDTSLIFNNVFSNTGNGYSNDTGKFTAPVSGVYYFDFNTFGYNRHDMGAILMKNGHLQVSTWQFKSRDSSHSASNSVVLPLNIGETVHIGRWKSAQIYDSTNAHTTFSGFLLFPL